MKWTWALFVILTSPAFPATRQKAVYQYLWTTQNHPFLGSVRVPNISTRSELSTANCLDCSWWVDEPRMRMVVNAPASIQTSLEGTFTRVDSPTPRLDWLVGLLADEAWGFRHWDFTGDETANFDDDTDGGGVPAWTSSASTWFLTNAPSVVDTRKIRKTDASVNQTVQARFKTNNTTNGPVGVVANWQSNSQFYLSYSQSGTWKIFYKDGGYTQIASAADTFNANTYYVHKLTTETSGSNKILNLYVDTVLKAGPVTTTTLYGSGRAGFDGHAAAAGVTITFDSFAFDTAVTISNIVPLGGSFSCPGGITARMSGTDFGDGVTITQGGIVVAGVTVISESEIRYTTPADTAGSKPVTYTWGMPSGETFTDDLQNALTYICAFLKPMKFW